MILQSLDKLYTRLLDSSESVVAQKGFSTEKIHGVVVIDLNGKFVTLKDIRDGEGKKKTPKAMVVPQSSKRSGAKAHENPFFLWDNTGFVLGRDDKGDNEKSELKFVFFKKRHESFLKDCSDSSVKALLTFMNKWKPTDCENLSGWEELSGMNLVFQIDGERQYLHEKETLKQIWLDKCGDGNVKYVDGCCCVTGKNTRIPNIHPPIKGVRGAQSAGAAIVSFNLDAFKSYGKDQNYNAPVGEQSVFAYSTALNYLLSPASKQSIQIGDATTVFWTERDNPVEGIFGMAVDPSDVQLSDNTELSEFLLAVRSGKKLPYIDQDINFYILGLSPNNSRLAIRFWHVSDVKTISEKLGQHFQDLQIQKQFEDSDPEFPGLWRILIETTNKKSKDGPPPLLAGAVARAIMQGTLYPQSLLSLIINRIRADQSINYIRASIIKAILVRKSRILNNKKHLEVNMTLDIENKQPAYLLGRLFAVLENTQKDALGNNINSTIKDRYYGSASATPRVVFPQLLRLAQHHIAKGDHGFSNDKCIEEIVCNIQEFPAHLTIDEQGLFALGYYHQRNDFFTKKEDKAQA